MLSRQGKGLWNLIVSWCVGLSLLLPAGCQAVKYESRYLEDMARKKHVAYAMTAAQLRQQLGELTYFYSGTIEHAADQIITTTTDRKVRQHALLWKLNAIPAAYRALFYPDPAVALIDAWALSLQMVAYFESGPGRNDFGPLHTQALEASRELEAATAALARSVKEGGDLSNLTAKLQEWVIQHPVVASDFTYRNSVIPDMSAVFSEKQLGTFDMVSSLVLSVEDISHQLFAQMDLLPKQARWETELLLTTAPGEAGVGSGLASLVELGSQLEEVIPVVTQTPDLVARERANILQAIHQERMAAFADIDKERKDTLAYLTRERMAVMEDLQALVDLERQTILKSVEEMRQTLLKDAEAAGNRMAVKALDRSKQVIDHLMLRVAQLAVAFIVALALIAGVFWFAVRKNKS